LEANQTDENNTCAPLYLDWARTEADDHRTQIGTPYYLFPKICEGGAYNAKTDSWRLGCILDEFCMLRHAFDAGGVNQLLRQIIAGRVAPVPAEHSQDV
jgi:NIMA (never in mitosis gene a)-related kinase